MDRTGRSRPRRLMLRAMSVHRIVVDFSLGGRVDGGGAAPAAGRGGVVIEGEEAQHALRVKRLVVGDSIELLDGLGHIATARVVAGGKSGKAGWTLTAEIERVRVEARVAPGVVVRSAVPKGPRLSELIEALSQVGAEAWGELECERSEGGGGGVRMDRVERIAAESSKQCGRAWRMEVLAPARLEELVRDESVPGAGALVMADGGALAGYRASGAERVTILIGPEGGWSERERALAREHGVAIASFGPHVMRIETAAPVAAALVIAAERRAQGA